jgi:anion-transporting  ArsA/GET3 family ATPase
MVEDVPTGERDDDRSPPTSADPSAADPSAADPSAADPSAAALKKAATKKAATKATTTKKTATKQTTAKRAAAKKAAPTSAAPTKAGTSAKATATSPPAGKPSPGSDDGRDEARSGRADTSGSIDGLLAAKEIVIACGPGGVGKTTTAAAAGVMAAVHQGGKVLVLTVDPAKRLADALGLEGIGNTERRVPDEAFRAAGLKPRGELWAAMLDTKQSWDALIRRHAPDPQTRDEILANPLYQNISGRFVQSHDYIAMDRLYEIHSEGDYDLIVVDTPPTRNALDFLDAPQRLADFFSSRLLRWLIVPYRSKLVNAATKPFYQIADRILGTQFLADISEFFILFQSMYDGFVERADAVGRLLSDRRTTFMVVSTLEAVPLREAEFFAHELTDRHLHLGAIVLNKVLPGYLRDPGAAAVAETMKERAPELAAELASWADPGDEVLRDQDNLRRVLTEVAESFLNFRIVAIREGEERAHLATAPEVLATVPFFDTDIYDLAGLVRLGQQIWS